MSEEIMNTYDAGLVGDGEPAFDAPDMTAVTQPTQERMCFYVQMHGYTQDNMEELIVQAAAKQIIASIGKDTLTREVEKRFAALVTEKLNKHLEGVTAEILDQPMAPAYGQKEPITMREFIGICGKDYLTTTVDRDGKPSKNNYDRWNPVEPRIQHIVRKVMDMRFEKDMTSAVNTGISEIQNEARAHLNAVIAEEKKRIQAALAKVAA